MRIEVPFSILVNRVVVTLDIDYKGADYPVSKMRYWATRFVADFPSQPNEIYANHHYVSSTT